MRHAQPREARSAPFHLPGSEQQGEADPGGRHQGLTSMAGDFIVSAARTVDGPFPRRCPLQACRSHSCRVSARRGGQPVLLGSGRRTAREQLANSLRIACEHRGQDRIVVPRLPESVPATWIDRLNGSPRQALNFLEPAVMNCVIAADTHVVVIRFTGAETGAEEQDDRSKPRRCLRFAQPAAKTDRRLRRQEPRYAPRSHW